MIAKLSGILDSVSENALIIDVNGVGYQVFASNRTLARLGQNGDPVSLYIQTQVREDAITLYGFSDHAEQEWFKLLTSVQGVGAKAGLSILSVVAPDKLGFAIASGDKAVLTQADGVGPKLATRILTELKDKAGKIDLAPQNSGNVVTAADVNVAADAQSFPEGDDLSVDNDAVSALVNLGYGRTDAYTAVRQAKEKANDNQHADLQALIKLALKELSS